MAVDVGTAPDVELLVHDLLEAVLGPMLDLHAAQQGRHHRLGVVVARDDRRVELVEVGEHLACPQVVHHVRWIYRRG